MPSQLKLTVFQPALAQATKPGATRLDRLV